MRIIDISWPLTPETTAYKDNKTISFQHTKVFESDSVRESKITVGSHSGTHIDAPSHFLAHGIPIHAIPLGATIGNSKVLDLTHIKNFISAEDLRSFPIKKDDIVLLKTANSALSESALFEYDFVYLDATGAQYLADLQVKCVGIDYLGIERNQPNHETHTILMQANIPIVEGLRLASVPHGEYFFVCLPLYIVGLEAAPARAILMHDLG